MSEIREVAKKLVEGSKGIFAADASPATLAARAKAVGMEIETEEQRREYREILFTAGLGEGVGGVIMHEESLGQSTVEGKRFTEVLEAEGVMPGVKVDKGTVEIPFFEGEKITEGLDGLADRLEKYKAMGAKFTKWRAVINIGKGRPSRQAVSLNAGVLARYAASVQQAGMVPMVEPEVIMEGEHDLEKCAEVTEMVGRMTFELMRDMKVDLTAVVYKTNMVIMGAGSTKVVTDVEIAQRTVEVLRKVVPIEVPAVVFLSGGQEPVAATKRLNEIVKVGGGVAWRWSFSYERALEEPVMKTWLGKAENKKAAQAALLQRIKMNNLASVGQYTEEMEKLG